MARLWLWLMVACPVVGICLLVAPLAAQEQDEAQGLHVTVQDLSDLEQYPDITITVRITDENGLIPQNLTTENFTVIVGGDRVTRLTVTQKSAAQPPLNLVIALDKSIAVDMKETWEELREIGNLAKASLRLQEGDHISFIVFSNTVAVVHALDAVVPDRTYTALHRAISTSLEVAAQMQQANPHGRAAVIVIADRPDNSQTTPPPLTVQELQALVASMPQWKPVRLYIYGYNPAKLPGDSPYAAELRKLVNINGGDAEFPRSLEELRRKVIERLTLLNLPDYDLNWMARQQVNKTYTLTISVNYTDSMGVVKRGSYTNEMTAPASPFTVTLDRSIAEGALVTPASTLMITATATQTRSALASLQYTLNQRTSDVYALTGSQFIAVLKQLPPGPITFTVAMTDQVGNRGQETTVLTVSRAISLNLLSPATPTVTQAEKSIEMFVLAVDGAPPFMLTPRIELAAQPGRPRELPSTTINASGQVSFPLDFARYLTETAQPWVFPAPVCWPEPAVPLGACLTRNTQLAWTRLISVSSWFTASAQTQATPFCSLHLMDYGRCIGQHEQALWKTLTAPRQQPAQMHTLRIQVVDSKGQRMALNPVAVEFNYKKPPFWRQFSPHRFTLLADVAVAGLLWLLGWWLWRRYKAAHVAVYTLRLENAGNTPTTYHVWATQPTLTAPTARNRLIVQPGVLNFTFRRDGQELQTTDHPAERHALAGRAGARKPPSAPAASALQPNPQTAQFDIHQTMHEADPTDPYAIAIGKSLRSCTLKVQPGDSIALELVVRARRRHWFRRTYRFVVFSEPLHYGAAWRRNSGVETIRFGGLAAPVRIDQLVARPPSLPPSPQPGAPATAPSVGAG